MGSDADAVRFTQRQINAGHVMYQYNPVTSERSSWLTWNGTQRHWPSEQDSFLLAVTTRGADPVTRKSVLLRKKYQIIIFAANNVIYYGVFCVFIVFYVLLFIMYGYRLINICRCYCDRIVCLFVCLSVCHLHMDL